MGTTDTAPADDTTDNGFNSLQTGKHMGTSAKSSNPLAEDAFQFPTNGKAHGNPMEFIRSVPGTGFNSLQTGKHMGTR